MLKLVTEEYLSPFGKLQTIELPDFTIITGPNGCGKSKLLSAIKSTAIGIEIDGNRIATGGQEVLLLSIDQVSPGATHYGALGRVQLDHQPPDLTRAYFQAFAQQLLKYDGLADLMLQTGGIKILSEIELQSYFSAHRLDSVQAQVRYALEKAMEAAENVRMEGIKPWQRPGVSRYATRVRKPICTLTDSEIIENLGPSFGDVHLFDENLESFFTLYRDIRLKNDLIGFRQSKGFTVEADYLDEQGFEAWYGAPPWLEVNACLATAQLDYEVIPPDMYSDHKYVTTLRQLSTGATVTLGDLSSGERILMALALSVFSLGQNRQRLVVPRVVLLDEVDAPLHPSMSKLLLQILKDTFVDRYGIKVILVTHSATTVALAPEKSIYVLSKSPHRLVSSSRGAALNALTFGVPTLALSVDGRRKIFVESPADVATYDALYMLLKSQLNSDRSLDFIAAGTRSEGGTEEGNGCARVKQLVRDLSTAGNRTIFGLLDWDGGANKPNDRIAVLANGKKNGIENVLLDPLLIAALIARDCHGERRKINIEDVSWTEFQSFGIDKLQAIVSDVTGRLFGKPEGLRDASYLGGVLLQVDQRCFSMDDHAYEKLVLETFPSFKTIERAERGGSAGRLLQHIVSKVLSDRISLIPVEIFECLRDLLERPAHEA